MNPYPLPRIEDLCTTLDGGLQFTTLDLKHVYNQVFLYVDFKGATTINTHRRLFWYDRLPFGVSSAPGIFQCIIDDLVKDMPHAGAYLDGILIIGTSPEAHITTLGVLFGRLC